MQILVHNKPVTLTGCNIIATRNHFADISQSCIDSAVSGETRVNDISEYIEWRKDHIKHSLTGMGDKSFTFIQRAYWIQSGECVPLLSK